ncbi:hypothetical protein C0Q70_13787 [Pomacea canaliculata]|uniref:Uncharacterized protein n=1 Tax=Pomacea canaliculata TaxID=400727 RepID=A0A2T7NY76_POMCA|nr:hypothetical protein C0Q70_13787 [Pomacea canaliculata]
MESIIYSPASHCYTHSLLLSVHTPTLYSPQQRCSSGRKPQTHQKTEAGKQMDRTADCDKLSLAIPSSLAAYEDAAFRGTSCDTQVALQTTPSGPSA